MYELWIVEQEHKLEPGMWSVVDVFMDHDEADECCKACDAKTRLVYVYADGYVVEDEVSDD